METALYFPQVQPPETPWFSHVLLYWDQAAVIAPRHAYYDPETSHTSELRAAGLLKVVDAMDAADIAYPLHQSFLEVVAPYAVRENDERWPRTWRRLYASKVDGALFRRLTTLGLAREGRFGQYDVEARTAAAYMGLLAKSVSREFGYFPVTAGSSALLCDGGGSRVESLKYASILQALPTPSRAVPVPDLVAFKSENQGALNRLRRALGARLGFIACIDDDVTRERLVDEAFEEIRDDVTRISERMASRRWPRVINEGHGVLAGGLSLAAAFASGGSALVAGLTLGAAAVATGDAVRRTVVAARDERVAANEPLAYAALVSAL